MAQRDLGLAKQAFNAKDVELSAMAHSGFQISAQEEHTDAGDFIKSLVYGGLDGIVTTFSVVATVAGASLSNNIVVIMGFANLIGDGIAMGLGDYLSERAEHDYIAMERKREDWEMENFPEGEKKEMVDIYVKKGVLEEDAKLIIDLMSTYKNFFVDHMLKEELSLMPVDESASPAKKGFATFLSFLVFGAVPLLAYVFFGNHKFHGFDWIFFTSCILTVFMMFVLGLLKGRIARQNPLKSGFIMVFNGAIAAGSAYLIGYVLGLAFGKSSLA
jgi:VIT1/CCC1 family predicted Fe2+/Mn2+ transporter